MVKIILVEKTGVLKEHTIKDSNFSIEMLYKKCKFRKPDSFEKRHTWDLKTKKDGETIQLEIYAKDMGNAGSENKYDLPPPVDNSLFFSTMAILKRVNNTYVHLSLEDWGAYYEQLFGGFENLADCAAEDENEEDELDCISPSKKTKNGGYLKDGFVVNTESEAEEEYDSELECETYTYSDEN